MDDQRSSFEDSFSQRQMMGEKLVPQHTAFSLSSAMKLIPPVGIILLLLFAFLGGGHILKNIVFARTTQTQQLLVNQSTRVMIRDDYGQVHVHGGGADTIVVRSTQYSTSWSLQTSPIKVDARVVDDGYAALINALQPNGMALQDGQRVDLDVTVPDIVALQVIAPKGAVLINGVSGSLHIESRDSINAQDVSSTRGDDVFSTQYGSIDVNRVDGQVEFAAPQGHIEIHDGRLFGQSRVQTDTGKIVFDGDVDPDGAYSFETQSGDISVSFPHTNSFDVNIFSDHGSVTNKFGSTSIGPPPRAQVSIATHTGNIEIDDAN
jgi:hypothetical protein